MHEKKISIGPKGSFLEEYEHLGEKSPGPGAYNAHVYYFYFKNNFQNVLPSIRCQKMDPKGFIAKHKEENIKIRAKP